MNSRKYALLAAIGRIVLTVGIILSFYGCGPTTVKQLERQKKARQLQPVEVLELVEANTLFLRSHTEETYYYFDPSGSLLGHDIANNRDNGKWDVADTGELCMRLKWGWHGDLRCFAVYTDDQRYYLANSARVIAFKADFFPGDHKNQYTAMPKAESKSIRRSLRGQQVTAASPPVQDASPASAPANEPVIIEERGPAGASASELQSTVKWMARDCPGCNLAQTNLSKADLVGAKLQGANLSGADLSMANLRRADLQGANLSNADLSYANLPGADLRDCNLKGANLKGANLIQADLTGADLNGADFDDALLEGTRGLTR
jgi:hypothetical protein